MTTQCNAPVRVGAAAIQGGSIDLSANILRDQSVSNQVKICHLIDLLLVAWLYRMYFPEQGVEERLLDVVWVRTNL
jgi:hypothetical protein